MGIEDPATGGARSANARSDASPSTAQPPVKIAVVDELKGAGPFALSASGVDLVLVRAASGWRAFEGRCPHQGALLGEGEISGGALVCRNHRWQFSIESGRRNGGPECLASYSVTERDGALWVSVPGTTERAGRVAEGRSLDELPGPRPMPLIGNFLQLEPGRAHQNFEEWATRYGSTYQIWIGRRRVVVSSDPILVEQVLRARPETFRRSENLDRILGELGVHGVFNAEGAAWRPLRKLSVAALAQRNLNPLFPNIEKVTARLKTRWDRAARAGETLDVVEELTRYTVDVTMLLIFGHDTNTVETQGDIIQRELEVILPVINRRLFAVVPLWRYVSTPSDRRLKRALANVRTWLENLLLQARASAEVDPTRAQGRSANVIQAMAAASDENGAPFADDAIISNLLTMLIAGEDTTAFTLAWAIHELCECPKWTEELRREADDVLGGSVQAKSAEDVTLLARAGAVANETMRLRPVGPLSFLDANVDASLGEYAVPKHTTISVLLRPAALDPVNFSDPMAFRPERWLDDPIAPHNISASMPFGSGPRMCPGRSLAALEMKALLAMLYKNFDVERVGDRASVSERYNGFTMAPAGLKVRLIARADIGPVDEAD